MKKLTVCGRDVAASTVLHPISHTCCLVLLLLVCGGLAECCGVIRRSQWMLVCCRKHL